MALTNDDLGYKPVGKERVPVEYQIPRRDLELVLGALMKKLSPNESVKVTRSEVEDAPDVEVRALFETDEFEMRVSV